MRRRPCAPRSRLARGADGLLLGTFAGALAGAVVGSIAYALKPVNVAPTDISQRIPSYVFVTFLGLGALGGAIAESVIPSC